jgi:hypothetical protein
MIETCGKRPRQPPIQCWGCKGDHKYRYCPHRSEKVRVVHNVQQAETMEDMGRDVPRIYVALDNKQAILGNTSSKASILDRATLTCCFTRASCSANS